MVSMRSAQWGLLLAVLLLAVLPALAQNAGSPGTVPNHPRPTVMHKGKMAPGTAGGPVKTASKKSTIDPSNFLVVLIAAVILVYGSHRALRPPFMDMSMSSEEMLAHEEAAEAGEMQLHTTFMFVIVSSCSLVLIFYFMSAMSILITVLFSFISSLSLGALVYPYVDRLTEHRFSREVDVPYLGPMPILFFILAPICIIAVLTWLLTKSWLLNNILAFSLIIFFLTSVRLSSLKVASSLLTLAFFYDIFWVFISSSIFGKNVMVTVATGLNVPIKILVPLMFSSGKNQQFTLIGLGDIVLPGLLLCFALRLDDTKGIDKKTGYFAVCMVGYCIGLTMCEFVVGTFHWAQPAMIYLVPGTLIPFIYKAWSRREIQDVWDGIKGHHRLDDNELPYP
mmetsp:Transcript_60432/g.138114  ORF Transcript_60432/g.138114 Transcript_60432/m.138114 type:complete len:394 (-) Transcript_60432:283-1464(-)